jgi:glycosyltransferase involved in cell wall biosynthesis
VAVRDGETGVLLDDPEDAEALADGLRRMLASGVGDEAIAASVASLSWPSVARNYAAVLAAHSG